ncbi:MAG TPA: type II toxin-antitoxin system PemK/MazF family toxin [Solirubrobacterales bacterium]
MSTEGAAVKRGEVYMVDLDPVVGHEQGGRRPFLLVSINPMNNSAARMAIGVPLTTTDRGSELHVRLDPPEGGLSRISFVMPEMVRSISMDRLRRRLGFASPDTLEAVSKRVGILIGLSRTR